METAVADKTIFREENERLRQELKSFHSYTTTSGIRMQATVFGNTFIFYS